MHYYGSYISKSIAVEINLANQGDETNNENVKFNIYLDENDRKIKEKTADINSKDMRLYISASVQNGGYLNNAQVELVDTNFKFKNSPETTKFKLDTIQSEKGITTALPIVAKNDESYNLDLLSMPSQIKLTGEYVDKNGNVTDINVTKAVKITWTADELKEENISLSQEVITNKIYNIDGANKRVIQVLVKSNIKENLAPVKSSTIEISNPQIGANPEKVKVASYSSKATNGKASIEFADEQNSSWEYKEEEQKTFIKLFNNPNDENKVTWTKNSEDEFVVTYIYDESANVLPFVSDVKCSVEVYGRTTDSIEKTNTLKLEELEEIGDIIKLENKFSNNIYKGKMYIGEDTNYNVQTKIYVPYSDVANNIVVQDQGDEIAEDISTYYKETKINKAEAKKVLGEEGTITIYNAQDKTTPIQQINLSEETDEDYYTISYDNIEKISIEMSKAVAEGTIDITSKKAIKVSNKDMVTEELKTLKSNTKLTVKDSNNNALVNANVESTAKLIEPKTTVNMSQDKTTISALSQNDVRITTELIAKDESNKLFVNPTLNIEMPAEIKEASIENITPVIGSDDLTIKSSNVTTNEAGHKVIVISMQGEQKSYSANAASIVIDAKLKTDAFMADKNVSIKLTSINGEETVEQNKEIKIVSKSGLVTKSTVKVGKDVVQKINQNKVNINANKNQEIEITTEMINNYNNALENGTIVGSVPEKAKLTSEVKTNIKDAKIYYSEEANTNANSENWMETVSSLDNVKTFKIVPTSNIEQSTAVSVNYKYKLEDTTSAESTIKVTDGKSIDETLTYVANSKQDASSVATNGVALSIESKTLTNTVHQGQILTYTIKAENTTDQTLNDIILDYNVPDGAVLTQLTSAQDTELIYTDDNESKNKTWKIDSLAPSQTISREVTIKVNIGATQIINNIALKNSDNIEIAKLTTDPIKVASGDLTVRLGRGANLAMEVRSNSNIEYIVLITNNTKNDINNLTVKSKVPDLTLWEKEDKDALEYNQYWKYNEQTKEITSTIDTIKAGETIEKRFIVKVDKLGNNVSSASIDNSAIVIYNGIEYETNIYTCSLKRATWKIEMTSEHSERLNIGDKIKYIIKVTNTGKEAENATVIDNIPKEIQVRNVTSYVSEDEKYSDTVSNRNVNIIEFLNIGETLTIEIEGVILDIENSLKTKQITNVAKVNLGNDQYIESNAITTTIVNDDIVKPENSDNPGNPTNPGETTNPDNPENPTNPDNPNSPDDNKSDLQSISGLAWLDINKDGIKDKDEKVLQAVKVILLDKEGKQIAETTTSLTGTYKFSELEQGEYTVAFVYDTSKYTVTKYQAKEGTETTNSDAISKEIEINGEKTTAGVTDIIKIDGQTVNSNIDIGLIENATFDLRLDKYISKVVLTNSSGTTTYEYEDTNFTKVEVSAKKIAGTVLLVEYELQITNEGDVDAYVGDLVDYLPDGLVFTSESNKEWYLDGNGVLHNKTLSEQVIKPKETKSVELVLTKTLKSDSTGTIENIGEIGASSNLQGITELDSVAGNKQANEDDLSTANLIVSIATGSPIMYIGIVIGTMLVLGLGIYIINKKVLKENI